MKFRVGLQVVVKQVAKIAFECCISGDGVCELALIVPDHK